ncbi:hypothetical protein [Tessaracoccus sp. Z1128]
MRDLAELVAGWIYALRITSGQQWVLRMIVLSSGLGAAVLCALWFPVVVSTALLVTTVLLAFASVVRPNSAASLGLVAVVALSWLAGGAGASWWKWLVIAAVVAVFHLTTAFAAAAPSYATITPRAAGRMARGAAGFVGASVAAGALVTAVAASPDGLLGPWWVVAGALAVAGTVVAVVVALGADPD